MHCRPGLVTYDTTSKQWYNLSSSAYPPTSRVIDGVGQFVPQFGPQGLIFFLGGNDDPLVSGGNLIEVSTLPLAGFCSSRSQINTT